MKHKTRTMAKRWLAVILCLCMIFPSAVTLVSAAEEPAYTGGPCEHHTEHTAECGYVEAMEGQLCTHVHDGNCGYQEPTEEIPCDKGCTDDDGDGNIDHQEGCAYQLAMAEQPCTHVHNEDCGYVEAVEGKPCTFVCEICSGNEAEPQDDGEVEYTINVPLAQNGISGVEYNLMAGVTVSPEKDADGNLIQVRVSSVTSSEEDFSWDETTTITPQSGGVVYTITYEAYVTVEEQKIVLATKTTTLTIMAAGDIGGKLDGDYAYISEAGLLEDKTTESGLAIRTGSAPWDDDDTAGNDNTDLNDTVRSFDIISYTAYFKSKVRDNAPYAAYETGTLHFEFILPGTAEQAQFETGSMGWLSAKKEVQYEITESTYNGQPCQVLRGSYLWEPSDENPSAIGESYQELTLVVRALALKNGDTLKPEFTFWLDHNDVPEEGLVTGSNHSCSEHREIEYKTITGPEVQVTAAPRYNVQVKVGRTPDQQLGTFDFSTGNDMAQNTDAGEVTGRVGVYGVTIQIQGKSAQHGLRGCELPDGKPITLDLTLSSEYRGTDGETHDTTESYQPLLWSMEGNSNASTQKDGRNIPSPASTWAYTAAPLNQVTRNYICASCKNGGEWEGTQENNVIHVTIEDYSLDLNQLPYTASFSDGNPNPSYTYYDPNTISGYWDIQTACFSAGEFWVVQPFYNTDGTYVVDEYGRGTFNTTLQDIKLRMSSESGQALAEVEDNSNQMTTSDDRAVMAVHLERAGTVNQNTAYLKYNYSEWNDPLTEGQFETGKDWLLAGNTLTIENVLDHSNAEGVNTGVAYDALIKFDDAFFIPESVVSVGYQTVLYGAKPDGNGWNHGGKQPNEEGYDTEMIAATADDLIFFSSLEKLESEGYTCVAVLGERRRVSSSGQNSNVLYLKGRSRADAQSGGVYMVTHNGKAWNKGDVQAAAAAYRNKDVSELTDEDYNAYVQSDAFPSRADVLDEPMSYEEDYLPSFWTNDSTTNSGLNTYQKAQYDEAGYDKGTAGRLYGDSCLVVGYATEITKSTAQQSSSLPKEAYDMDVGQRIADYVLYPSAVRSAGESSTGGELTTTVYVEDTLPKGLTYIPNSSYWGGTYTQTEEGKQGTVEGGQQIKPEITANENGTTTLRWILKDVTITSKEVTEIAPIYYSCDIGKPGDEENDVQNNDQLLNTAIIWSDNEQRRDFEDYNNNLADFSILISKNNAVSLSKLADQAVVDQGDTMGFTLNVGNNATNPMAVIAMDSLPYVGDTAGSAFTGDCVVTEYAITALQGEFASDFKLYYTTSERERGKGSEDYTKEDFTKEGSVWTELAVNSTDGTVTLPEGEFKPVAIAAVGTLPAQQTLKMHVTMDLPDAKPGEYVANRLTRGDLESFGRSYIVSRTLEGVVWLDDNKNGLRGGEEAMIDGVTATLMELKDGGDSTKLEDYEAYQVSGMPASVSTGKMMDLSTGTVTDYSSGRYKFSNLPAGTFGVLFSDGTVALGEYTASPKDQGTDDTLDSDAEPVLQDDVLKQAFIPNIVMPPREQITTMVYASRYHDLGLYASQINIPVEKVWDDNSNQDGKRPSSVTVTLYANGNSTDQTLTLSEANDWKGTFENLDEFLDGEKINYTVKEAPVSGYTTEISGSASGGFTITNSHTPETITISGSKTWNDNDNQDGKRPESITIRIYANGTELTEKALTVTADNDWKWSFTDLPKYSDGKEILYTITEDTVEGYTSVVNGYDVTNTYSPEQTSVSVRKVWKDNNNQDGIQPESITVKLLADGKAIGDPQTLSGGNNWTYTFTDLDKYRDGGEEIVYTIEEVKVDGYETSVTGDASTGFVITNSHTPETTEISGSKTWDDADNQDGKRPTSITIRLYANGTELTDQALTVTADDDWKWSFTDLPKYAGGKEIVYTISEDAVPGYTTEVNGFNVTNSYTPGKTSVSVRKVWKDNNNQDGIQPESITVKLLADGKAIGDPQTLSGGNNWTYTFTDLDKYRDGGEEIVYTIEEVKVDGYETSVTGDASTGFVITNSHTPETISISGSKTWDDANDQDGKRPESITVSLLADGSKVSEKEVTASDNWTWTFENLPKYKDGKLINYTIQEETVPGYTPSYSGYNVTNSYTPGKVVIPVTKSWQDNNDQDGLRPQSVTVKLLADGKDTGKTLILSEGNGWSGTFTGLDEYAAGEKIAYTVEEVAVNGYDTAITGDASNGFTITNAHNPETITLSGAKTWNDADNQDGKRPDSITIRLYANGTELKDKAVTVTADDGWKWSFAGLPKYADGKEITYTISEDAVDGYTPAYTDFDVTNTYTPEQTSITVTKAWADNNDQDGLRPESITVKLLADGADTKETLTLSSGNNWTGTFNNLDKYRDGGEEIVYTIEEVEVSGYDTVISGDASKGFVITNSHTPATTEVSGSKTWDDKDDQDGKRPDSITIRLYANGEQVDNVTVTAENDWKWSFTNLPEYENGSKISYTITEDAVPGYTSVVNGYNVTNSYTPGKTSVTVTKTWNDAGNQDGLRTGEITVKLLADGKDTGKTLTLSKENRWMGIFTDLDEYKDGQKIVYTVEEVSVKGYDSVITGDASTGFVITNSHTPAKIDLSGSKTWDDADNQDGKRPDSITIRLYANGEQVKVVTVTADDGWKWNFTNLPKYENGSEIRYTITEDVVPGYQSEVDGMDVTNHYTPGQINIPVTKNWQDKDDADGIRPDSITVKLYADGKDTGRELILDQENNWTGSFDELDEYAGGVKIVYTIAEIEVKGYDTAISGSAETGFVISNSHTPDIPDTPKDDTPQTGDTTNLALWVALLAISGTGLTATLIIGKKKRYRGKHMK